MPNFAARKLRLNPYYNGKYSMSSIMGEITRRKIEVLILIIMENTL